MKCLLIFPFLINYLTPTLIKIKCPVDEMHISCSRFQEYTCWYDHTFVNRVRMVPKMLKHCRSGCVCRKNYVRSYPNGRCILAADCRNLEHEEAMKNMPEDFSNFLI